MSHSVKNVSRPRRFAASLAAILAVSLGALTSPAASLAATTSPAAISSFSPTSGPVGTLVTIKGTHFDGPGLQVSFGGTAGTPETVTPKVITIRVPALAPTGQILVATRYGTAQTRSSFRVTRGIASFPRGAWPGQDVTLAGSGLPAFHDITLKLDGSPFGGVATNANGQFSIVRTLPGDLTIGAEHILVALDTITHVPQKVHIWIFGSWPQARDDAAQTGNGAAEFLINTSNVAKVHQHYAVYPLSSPVVEDGGKVYVGLVGGYLIEFDPYAGTYGKWGWSAKVDGNLTQPPAVANGVVYAVTDDTLYAFAEHQSGNPRPYWTAALGDAAHPFAPVVADGRVYVADGGTGELLVFDANGVTNCPAVLPPTCNPLWFATFNKVFGPPAIDAKSSGGSGDVYLSVQNTSSVNKLVVRTGAGATAGSSVALASTSLSAPSVAGGRVFLSGWSAGSATATLYALDASTQTLLWNSNDLGGSTAPTAVAVGGGHTFVQNSDGTLRTFKSSGCGTSVCDPAWSSVNYGPGGTTPPTYANGVVYTAAGDAGLGDPSIAKIEAYDANGSNCLSGTPLTCQAIAYPNFSGISSQITVVAGTVFGFGSGQLMVAELN